MTSWSRRVAKPTVASAKGLRLIIQKAGFVAVPYRDCLAFDPELRPHENAAAIGARLARAGLGIEYGMPQVDGDGAQLRLWWPEWRWDGGRDVTAGAAARAKEAVIPHGVPQHIAEAFAPQMRPFLDPLDPAFVESMEADGAATLTCMGIVVMISHSAMLGWIMSAKTKQGANTDDPRIFGLLTISRDRWDRIGSGYWMAKDETAAGSCDPRGE